MILQGDMLKAKYIAGIFGLIAVGLTLWLLKPHQANQASTPSSEGTQILMTEKGFEPEILTIKAGTKITFTNKDNTYRWPASDLHPTHTIYPEFDPKQPIEPEKSWLFTFNRVGQWNYHDHLSPLVTGKVIVNE